MTDAEGLIEHAEGSRPIRDLGYCTDDAGRLLAVAAQLVGEQAHGLCHSALDFLDDALEPSRGFRLRRLPGRHWSEDPPSDDATARALQGLGVAVAHAPWREVRERSRALFLAAGSLHSPHPRANAHALLGALAFLSVEASNTDARTVLDETASGLPEPSDDERWPWPAERLTYENALIPEAMLAVAHHRHDTVGERRALDLLDWLVERESLDGHCSFTPNSGRGVEDVAPQFDQQPIEAWAMADAALRAFAITGEERWVRVIASATSWFEGDNDVGVPVGNPTTGASFDALTPRGVNTNQGAESTLAFVAVTSRHEQVSHHLVRTTPTHSPTPIEEAP